MYLVGDISMDKDFPRLKAKDCLGWDSRICTSDPTIFGALGVSVSLEVIFVLGKFLLGPLFVVVDDFFEVVHV